MTELRKQFKIDKPETVGETDKAFDDSNYIDWLESKIQAMQQVKNNDSLHSIIELAFDAGRERIPHPDFDFVYEDHEEFYTEFLDNHNS